jgi:hypothetical protein
MRGTGIFLAIGLLAGFFVGQATGYVVWGTFAGFVAGIAFAVLTNLIYNKNR